MANRSSVSISSAFDFLNDPVYAGKGTEKSNDTDGIACINRESVSDTQLLHGSKTVAGITSVSDTQLLQGSKNVAGFTCLLTNQEISLKSGTVPGQEVKKQNSDTGNLTFSNALPCVIKNSITSEIGEEERMEEQQKDCAFMSYVEEGEINLKSESCDKPLAINENLFSPKCDELNMELAFLSSVVEGDEHENLQNENYEKTLTGHTDNSNEEIIIQKNYGKNNCRVIYDLEASSNNTSDMKVDNYCNHQNKVFANNTEDAMLNAWTDAEIIRKHKICDTECKTDTNTGNSKLSDQNHENDSEIIMRNWPRDSVYRSRRADRIVSDAFHFLKIEDEDNCDIKDIKTKDAFHQECTCSNSMPENETSASLQCESACTTDENDVKLDHRMLRSNAFDEPMFDAVDGSQESVSEIMLDKLLSSDSVCNSDDQNECSSSEPNDDSDIMSRFDYIYQMEQSADVSIVNFEEEQDETDIKNGEDLSLCIDAHNSCEKIDFTKFEILKSEQSSCVSLTGAHIGEEKPAEIILRKLGKKNGKEETDDHTDNSSDDDTQGIYNAATRNSRWLRVDKNGVLSMSSEGLTHKTGQSEHSSTTSLQSSIGENVQPTDNDETVDIGRKDSKTDSCQSPSFSLSRKRSDSTTTTLSEKEFKQEMKKRMTIRMVKRHSSQQEYQRHSTRFYDMEKLIFIEKMADDGDIGLHILDTHPAIIKSVDPGSPAAKAGIEEGQILVSVNGVCVLELPHSEIIKLVQQYPRFLRLEVGITNMRQSVVTDLQVPMLCGMMFKQSTLGLIKTWKKRYFVLRQDNCLYYYKNQNDLDPLGAILLYNYSVSRYHDTNKQYCFKAGKYGSKTFYFMTESGEEMTKWVGALKAASARTKDRANSWMDVTSQNVGLPALEIRKPECTGYLSKLGRGTRTWRKRYCILKDACIYYYKKMNAYNAQGVAHLHGYTVQGSGVQGKKHSFALHPPEKQMKTFFYCADNPTDRERWMAAMTTSIQRWVQVEADVSETAVNSTLK